MSKLRESMVWAIRYNHSWNPSGYAVAGLYFAFYFISCLIVSLISGAYFAAGIFGILLVIEGYIAKFILRAIKDIHV